MKINKLTSWTKNLDFQTPHASRQTRSAQDGIGYGKYANSELATCKHSLQVRQKGVLGNGTTIRNFRIVQTEGTNQATRLAKRHSHDVMVAKIRGLGNGE